MRAKKRKGKSIVSLILAIVVIVALLGSLFYLIANIDDIGNIDIGSIIGIDNIQNNDTFRIVYNEQEITGQQSNLRFVPGEDNTLTIDDAIDYEISIVPAQGVDFDFVVDSNYYSFAAESDYTNCFDITENEGSIVINSSFRINEILQNKYPDSEIAIFSQLEDIDYFTLIIESGDKFIKLNFGCDFSVSGVEINYSELVVCL